MKEEIKYIKDKLISDGIKPTFPRLKIYKILSETVAHPNVESIYDEIKKEIPTISKTTVYNTLNLFIKKGIVNELVISGNDARFDGNVDPHHHFYCIKCNRIFDLPKECCLFQEHKVADHKITEMHGYFKGICKDCLREEE